MKCTRRQLLQYNLRVCITELIRMVKITRGFLFAINNQSILPSQSQSRKRFQGSNVIPSSVVLEMLSLETTMYFLNIPSSFNALSSPEILILIHKLRRLGLNGNIITDYEVHFE